jgi:hypothetical protein
MSLYTDRIAAGLCGIAGCTTKPEDGKKQCEQHRKIGAERAAAKRAEKRASGRCITAGCNNTTDISPGGRCPTCRKAAAADAKRYGEQRMASGLCRNAASHGPVKPGCTMCQACIDRLSNTSSEHYFRRKESGLCRFCNDPPVSGESMCPYHKEKYTDYRLRVKMEVMEAYGNCRCSHPGCDNTNIDELHLHHVAGGGNAHRRELGSVSGYQFYLHLRAENYPAGFAVLCPTHHVRADNTLRKG